VLGSIFGGKFRAALAIIPAAGPDRLKRMQNAAPTIPWRRPPVDASDKITNFHGTGANTRQRQRY